MQIVILDGHAVNPGDLSWDCLRAFGTLSVYDRTPAEFTAQRLIGADVVFTNKTAIDEAALERARNLRMIGLLSTGYDVVDLAAATRRGIVVCNVPSYSTDAVVQHTFALLLEICSLVTLHDREVHRGRWTHSPDFCFWDAPLIELSGKTFGILGCGEIGCRVPARRRRSACASSVTAVASIRRLSASAYRLMGCLPRATCSPSTARQRRRRGELSTPRQSHG